MNNIPQSMLDKIGINLYKQKNHPISNIKKKIFEFFKDLNQLEFDSPYVPIVDNFDNLRIPKNHPSRSLSDTFYKDENTVLRTHMTSYIYPVAKTSVDKYITCGDVYRKDEIDQTHFPIFHQIDAFCIVPKEVDVKADLRSKISGLIKHLFGDCEFEFLEDYDHKDVYFPFTVDSFEVNVSFTINGIKKNVEVLGAGTVHPDIMKSIGKEDCQAWAFGLGIERLAMIMYDIPDIRLFWTKDDRFLSQFKEGELTKFKPYSKYELCYKDISFYVGENFSHNDFCTIARDEDANNFIESIFLVDEFNNKGRLSKCYRVNYRSMDRTLLNSEVDSIQNAIRARVSSELNVTLR